MGMYQFDYRLGGGDKAKERTSCEGCKFRLLHETKAAGETFVTEKCTVGGGRPLYTELVLKSSGRCGPARRLYETDPAAMWKAVRPVSPLLPPPLVITMTKLQTGDVCPSGCCRVSRTSINPLGVELAEIANKRTVGSLSVFSTRTWDEIHHILAIP